MTYIIRRLEDARFSGSPAPAPAETKTMLVTVLMLMSRLDRFYGDFHAAYLFNPAKAGTSEFPDALRQAVADYIKTDAGQKRFAPEEDGYAPERLSWFDVIGDIPIETLFRHGITVYSGIAPVQIDGHQAVSLGADEYFTADGLLHGYTAGSGSEPF